MRVRILERNDDGRGKGADGGRAVLVSQAHPGEEVSVRVDKTTRGTIQGRVASILERDERRIPHECRHEFHCTGCPLLAAHPDDEAAFKTARLRALLADPALAGLPPPEPLLSPGPLFGYRHLAKQVFGTRGPRTVLGSFVAGTHKVVDNWQCPVLAPALREFLDAVAAAADHEKMPLHEDGGRPGLRHVVARLSRSAGTLLLLVATSEDPPGAAIDLAGRLLREHRLLAGAHVLVQAAQPNENALLAGTLRWSGGAAHLPERILGFTHHIGPRSFFQVNPAAAEVMFRIAVEAAGAGAACVDAYAGVGALTLPLSRAFSRVVAVESSAEAADSLEEAAARSGAAGVEVVRCRVEDRLPAILGGLRPEAVVLDPPRAGAGPGVMAAVGASAVKRCVLLSCEPATLPRDLPPLLAAGFRVRRLVPIDQFPRTGHFETVVALGRE